MNPILPWNRYVPDAEAHVCSDGKLYIYGSQDIYGSNTWCSKEYRVYSTDDMENWTDHGISFSTSGNSAGEFKGSYLYAPDCIEKDGRHYLYFCTAAPEGIGIEGGEGVAVSDNPYGPFEQARAIPIANGDGIDPAIFTDDDGESYLFWGQFRLRGAKLKKNMCEIDETTLHTQIIDEQRHGFHEGSSMRKRNGIYYLIYADISSGKPTRLSYVMGKTPFGPFENKGIIIDNIGCDPSVWNNHGSIEEFNGKWYVFYHRSAYNDKYNRRVCAEPISFNDDGTINRVEMTTQGAGNPINPRVKMQACRACLLGGNACMERNENEEYICANSDGDSAVYKYYDFGGDCHSFTAAVKAGHCDSRIEIRTDDEAGELLGTCEIAAGRDDNWTEVSCKIKPTCGKHGLCLVFRGSGSKILLCREFYFE